MSEAVPTGSALRRSMGIIAIGIRRQPGWFALAVGGSLVYGVMTALTAAVIGHVTQAYVTPAVRAGEATPRQLWLIGGSVALAVLVTVVGVVFRRLAGGITMFNVAADFRRQVTRQYLRLPLAWHHRHPSGQLLSNANADVEATWNVFAPLPMAIGVLVMLVVSGVQMLLVDPVMALIGLTVLPALFVANSVYGRRMSPRVTRAQQLRADVSEVAHESFEAALVVKAMGREDREADRFAGVTDELRSANIAVGRTRAAFDPVIEAIPTLGTLAVLGVGTARVVSGDMSAGDVVQVAYLISVLAFPVRALGWVLGEIPRTVVGWDRVNAVLQARGELTYGDRGLPPGPQDLVLDDVHYTYAGAPGEAPSPAVRGISAVVPAGSTTALVGPTGSGKSTLVGLLSRQVDPDRGTVRLAGTDLREVRRGGIPEAVALVPQQTFLFDDTVRGNVTLGDASIDDHTVWKALGVAQAEVFVARLPDGLDTRVGERGTSLSGGQRQRIALARAIVRRPGLLLLDDATSAVDPSVEQDILAALRHSSSGTTVVVVAYRMATIALADHVLYVEHGRLVDQGSHPELLARCRGYRDLVTAYEREAAEREAIREDEEAARSGAAVPQEVAR